MKLKKQEGKSRTRSDLCVNTCDYAIVEENIHDLKSGYTKCDSQPPDPPAVPKAVHTNATQITSQIASLYDAVSHRVERNASFKSSADLMTTIGVRYST